MSDCLVTDKDFTRHFRGRRFQGTVDDPPPQWTGTERRLAVADRRVNVRDRRWDSQRSRRYRHADRRKA